MCLDYFLEIRDMVGEKKKECMGIGTCVGIGSVTLAITGSGTTGLGSDSAFSIVTKP